MQRPDTILLWQRCNLPPKKATHKKRMMQGKRRYNSMTKYAPIVDIKVKESRHYNADINSVCAAISTISGDENDDEDYVDDPQFQVVKSAGTLMKESHERKIFEMALQRYPHLQGELSGVSQKEIGFFQHRLRDGRVIWSPGMFTLSGRDPTFGTPPYEEIALNLVESEEKDGYLTAIQPVLEGKAESADYIKRAKTYRGTAQLLRFIYLPVLSIENKVEELCGCCWKVDHAGCRIRDVAETDTCDADRALELARKERLLLENAIAEKNNFIAYVFHEVRNPINAVYLGLQALEEEMNDPEMKKLVAVMRNSTERAMSILNDTLEYSKFELGNVYLKKSPVKISDCVKECVDEFKVSAQKRNILLTMNVECDSVCEIDKMRIVQVLNNLLSNALKFTPNNGYITITIECETERGREWAKISVSDNGVGIKEEDRDRIFTPYNQIDNQVSGMKGMGIGLSISKKIVDAHYGDMSVQSTAGQGATFTVELPAVKRAVRTPPQASCEKGKTRILGEMEGLRVLLVDDDSVNLFMLQRMLTKNGCIVDCMKDGEEFLAFTRNPKGIAYDLILLDDFMPNLDGSKAIEMARSEGFLFFSVLATGNTNDETIKDCGANEVIYKPLRFNDLKEIVLNNSL